MTLISSQRAYLKDLASFLFGDVLGVSAADIWTVVILAGLVLALVALFYKELVLNAFDPVMAAAAGYPTFLLDLLLLGLLTVTIIIALPALGNILVLAMLITPAATARLLVDRFPPFLALSAALGSFYGAAGLMVAYRANLAAGGTIVLLATAGFGVTLLLSSRARRAGSVLRPASGATRSKGVAA